jgi:hypothetical protein
MRALPESLDELEKCIDLLESTSATLIDRLTPTLGPPPPEESNYNEKTNGMVTTPPNIHFTVRRLSGRLQSLNALLSNATNRLDF